MDAKQFLAEFGHIANAPGGVQRLRELVLQFAIQGKLVAIDVTDESTVVLLDKIKKEKKQLIKDKVLPDQKIHQHSANAEIATDSPAHWAKPLFGDVWLLVSGRDLEKNQYNENKVGIPYITGASNIENGDLVINRWTDHAVVISHTNDLLISCKGTIGKTVFNTIGYAHIARQIMAIRPYSKLLNSKFLKIWLDSFVLQLVAKSKSMIPGFSRDDILYERYPLPPLEEQSRIVAKVDELMALCDKLEAQQQKKRQLQNKLRQSVLQAVANAESPKELQDSWERLAGNFSHLFAEAEDVAELRNLVMDLGVSGRLTCLDSSDTPVSALLEMIKSAKRNGIQKGEIKALKPVVGEVLGESFVPAHWSQIVLDDALAMIDSGWSPKCMDKPKNDDDTWGILKTTAVQKLQFISHENKQLPVSLKPKHQYETRVGDILITRAGPSNRVGICCVVDKVTPRLMISDKIIRFRIVDDLIDARFVALSLSAGETAQILEKKKSGMASSQMNITQDRLRALPILLPPREEQVRILDKIQQMMIFCDTLEEKLSSKQKTAERLATAAIASLTGISTPQQEEPMKVPKTELKAPVRLGTAQPPSNVQAPLASLLARHNGEMGANDLWQRFGGEVDAFYAQLKTEVMHGWIAEPTGAQMLEKEDD